jgi:hypothetical protein
VRSSWYASVRQRQLVHVNLWSIAEWTALLNRCGFSEVDARPYMFAAQCRLWDRIDAPAALGWGRYRVGTVVPRLVRLLIPRMVREFSSATIARALDSRAYPRDLGEPTAALIVAS